MKTINIEEILPFVEMPSQYLGCEANSIKKELSLVDLKFALAFPDLYEIGTSHFGMQILYTILNQKENIAAERFFTPAPDMEKIMREKNIPLFSLESEVDFKSFDIIGFSLLYELNFTNILTMLSLSGIPFYASDRNYSHPSTINIDSHPSTTNIDSSNIDGFPLIIAGGPCAFNPEPLADFFDAFVIGDGEEAILEISKVFIQWKKDCNDKVRTTENKSTLENQSTLENKNTFEKRKNLLERLSKIEGVYVPSFFKATYKAAPYQKNEMDHIAPKEHFKLIQHLEPLLPEYERIKRAILPDISSAPFPTSPIVPFGKPVHDRLRLEIARGCSRGCRFCQAGMIYRPVRERSVNDLVEIAKTALKQTGYSDLSLLSLSTGDYGNLPTLMEQLMAINSGHCISISLPSVRAGKLNAPLMQIIKKVKKTGFTIAPEAGTQRLRDVINKNITENDIFTTVNSAFELGWRNIKLYFMNGLPTETSEDIEAIADMSKRLAGIKMRNGKSTVNVSFATFIPKAHTPFQRVAQIHPDKALENLNFLKQNLRHPGINLKWQNPKMSLLEGVWARGDRRLSKVLVKAWEKGCRLDGWSDMFNFDLWEQAFDECGIDLYSYLRQREKDEPLPWSHIDCGISDKFMEKEFEKAMTGELTQDCREFECIGCGICDFKKIEPVLYPATTSPLNPKTSPITPFQKSGEIVSTSPITPFQKSGKIATVSDRKAPVEIKTTIFYSRLGKAKYFGHLELAKIIRRAIRRSGIQVKYSTGFSPAMKISFDNPLPVGMESEEEFFTIRILAPPNVETFEIVKKLNEVLPRSITITRCIHASPYLNSENKNKEIKKTPSETLIKQISSEKLIRKTPSNSYRINLKTFYITQQAVDDFMALSEYIVDKLSFKGIQRTTDLRKITENITLLNGDYSTKSNGDYSTKSNGDYSTKPNGDCSTKPNGDCSTQLEITLKNHGQRTIRPSEILTEIFQVPNNILHTAETLKLK